MPAASRFETFYAGMLAQKIERIGPLFQAFVPTFAQRASALVQALRTSENTALALVHGDFFPGNVLVNDALDRVTGVIDFGSFTLFGNTLLDVAGAFGFYQMYAPDRAAIRERLLAKIRHRLTPDEQPAFFQFLLAHAILTSDLYVTGPRPTPGRPFPVAAEIVADAQYWDEALSG